MAQDLKALVDSWFAMLNREDWEDHIDEFDPGQEWWEEWKEGHRQFRRAFPDFHFTVDRVFQDGEHVAFFGKATGTHSAEFPSWELRGIAPTGKKLTWDEAYWWRVEDGRFVDGYFLVDGVSRLIQLGILPEPEEMGSV